MSKADSVLNTAKSVMTDLNESDGPYAKLMKKAEKIPEKMVKSSVLSALREMDDGEDEQDAIDYVVDELAQAKDKSMAKAVVKFFQDAKLGDS